MANERKRARRRKWRTWRHRYNSRLALIDHYCGCLRERIRRNISHTWGLDGYATPLSNRELLQRWRDRRAEVQRELANPPALVPSETLGD